MANQVLITQGTPLCFCVNGTLSPADPGTDWRGGRTVTNVLLTLAPGSPSTGIADGTGRQSDKVDLGATRAPRYAVYGCVDYTGETPTSGATVDYYWAPSPSTTQANSNVAGNSGADGTAPTGAVPTSITLAEFLSMCQFIGSLVITDDASVINGYVGMFSPAERYGQLVVVNNGGDKVEDDDVEHHQVMVPIIDEVQ